MARRTCCWAAHLVLVLVAVARCSADQQQQHSGGSQEQLLALVSRAVAAAAEPIVAELGSQRTLLDGIVSRLEAQDARLDSLKDVLDSQGTSLDALNTHLASLDALNARLDGLDALKVSQHTLNASLVAPKVGHGAQNTSHHLLNASLDALNTHLNSTDAPNTRLDSIDASIDVPKVDHGAQNTSHARVNSSVVADQQVTPRDCSDLPTGAGTGVYTIRPGGNDTTSAFCDMDTDGGGWTVFQRRADLLPRQNFFLEWADYRAGFGNMTGEFWWGLEKLHLMTSALDRRYELRVDLGAWDGRIRHALYRNFGISPETDGYRLSGGNYTGDYIAGDCLSDHFGQQFSTKDRDNDEHRDFHCAQARRGAWWFKSCAHSHLNGEYYVSGDKSGWYGGVLWPKFRGYNYSLKTAEMKVRPTASI